MEGMHPLRRLLLLRRDPQVVDDVDATEQQHFVVRLDIAPYL